MKLTLKQMDDDAIVPTYATPGSACFDLYASSFLFSEHERRFGRTVSFGLPQTFSVGFAFGIPEGYCIELFGRSGHGFKLGVRLSNCVGIIDSDYTDRVLVSLTCDRSDTIMIVKPGDRIAQGRLVAIDRTEFETDSLPQSARSSLHALRAGGFGSTGA